MSETLSASPLVLAAGGAYLLLMLAIGVWSLRRTKSAADFYIAGRSRGILSIALATMASAFSGVVFIGGPGLTYRLGVDALFICLSVGFTGGLLVALLGRRLFELARRDEDVLTIPDAIQARFNHRGAAALAALAVAAGSVAYLAAQLLALGILVQALFGLPSLLAAVFIGTLVLAFYSTAGGMIAGIVTDVVQGLLMLVAAAWVFGLALHETGGPAALAATIAADERFGPGFLEPLGRAPAALALGFFLVFGVGVLGQPHMLHKFFMLRDARSLRLMPALLGLSQSVVLLVWVGIGLAVPALVAGGRLEPLARPDDATPAFLLAFAPSLLAGLVLAGALAAIMSTADSFLSIGAGALVRDLPRALGRPLPGGELLRARLATPLLALAAAALALGYGDLVALLGTFAFGTFAAALGPALALGLTWERVSGRAAALSIGAGATLNLGLEATSRAGLLEGLVAPGAPPAAIAMLASFALLVAASWAWPAPGARSL